MTPSQLSAQLRHIAAKINDSKSPRRDLVANDLRLLITKISSDEIPSREPDEINEKGDKIWNLDDQHSIVESPDGSKFWYQNGKFHRESDPAIEWSDGTKMWYQNGKRHREDGPAIEFADGTKAWFLNGDRHRDDGPALEFPNGTQEWWINGEKTV